MRLQGGCHCGNIRLDIALSAPPSSFQVRICDCDFCRQHGAGFISDVHGSLVIQSNDQNPPGRYQQGSGTADFLFCQRCGVFVAVTCQVDGRLYAAINYRAIDGSVQFGDLVPVSPKVLSASAKVDRWKMNWFCDVSIR